MLISQCHAKRVTWGSSEGLASEIRLKETTLTTTTNRILGKENGKCEQGQRLKKKSGSSQFLARYDAYVGWRRFC